MIDTTDYDDSECHPKLTTFLLEVGSHMPAKVDYMMCTSLHAWDQRVTKGNYCIKKLVNYPNLMGNSINDKLTCKWITASPDENVEELNRNCSVLNFF